MAQNFDKKLILLVVIVTALVITGGVIYYRKGAGKENVLSSQEVGQKIVDYANENIPGINASLVDVSQESGLYKVTLRLGEEELISYATKDGKLFFPQAIDLESEVSVPEESEEKIYTIGNFSVSENEICREDGKPIIYFFGSTGCSHCQWEHPIIETVASKFGENIVFHNNMDSDADMDIFREYSTGGIPTLIFGCKYYRVGSGEALGEEEENRVLTALICMLTENQPTEVCDTVQDLIK